MHLTEQQQRLIDGWQRDLPLVPRPYEAMGATLGLGAEQVIALLAELQASGVLSRVGATVRPNTAGASLLAAMRVPSERLDEVAAIVSAEPCVNHNYEREHVFNLWFVVAAPDRAGLDRALDRLRAATGLAILELPMERAYYLDLGFPLDLSGATKRRLPEPVARETTIDPDDRRLLAALADGLPLVDRPYLALARRCGTGEAEVIARLRRLLSGGVVSRLGLIVRHRALGIDANAMAVWDIDDGDVDHIGATFAAAPFVTLCYRRPRRRPDWPYNLFTMVHGRDRDAVAAQVAELAAKARVPDDRRAVLFSRRCFVQRGARFKAA